MRGEARANDATIKTVTAIKRPWRNGHFSLRRARRQGPEEISNLISRGGLTVGFLREFRVPVGVLNGPECRQTDNRSALSKTDVDTRD